MQDFDKNDSDNPPEAPRGYFLSLGAGQHQLPLISAARRLGFPVVAVDRNLKAPGFAEAAIQLQCSIVRPRRILQMLGENLAPIPIAGVGCRSFGRAGMTAAILAHANGTPGNPLRVLRRFQNKRRLKTMLAEHGVPIPPAFPFGTLAEREIFRKAPGTLLVRPASGHGKLGLRLLKDKSERSRFLQIHLRDTGRLLVEMLVAGQEVTVLGMVQGGRYAPIALSDKRVSQVPPLYVELGHDFPANLSAEERETIQQLMQTIVTATGLENGPIVAEFILQTHADAIAAGKQRKAREPLLVECAPEIGGEFLADILVPAMSQSAMTIGRFPTASAQPDYFEELVRLYTGGVFRADPFREIIENPAHQVLIRFVPQRDGVLKSIELPEDLERQPGFLFARLLKQPGQATALTGGNLDRLAVFALSTPWPTDASLDDRLEQQQRFKQTAGQLVQAIQNTVTYE